MGKSGQLHRKRLIPLSHLLSEDLDAATQGSEAAEVLEPVVASLFPTKGKKFKEIGGGGGEIRTHGRVAPTTIFKTVAFNRSATPPGLYYNRNILFN
jgi:hypothetical protein